jgi:Leucine-rich repeat (LRR) protein
LDLSRNQLMHFFALNNASSSLHQLEALNLSSNQLTAVQLAHLPALRRLDLSANPRLAANISSGSLVDLPGLRVLNLSSLGLTHIPSGTGTGVYWRRSRNILLCSRSLNNDVLVL